MKKLTALLALVAVALTLSACANQYNKNDVCHEEGGERNQHEVCVKK